MNVVQAQGRWQSGGQPVPPLRAAAPAANAKYCASWALALSARMLADEYAPGRMRKLISAVAEQEHLADTVEATAHLLATELVTNSYRAYATAGMRGGASVFISVADEELCVSIADTAPGVPALFPPSSDRESGRGLALVDSLSREWSWAGRSSHKVVWFSLGLAMPEPEPDLSLWPDLA